MSKGLVQRGLAYISHTSIGKLFKRYHLPTCTYHIRARSDEIPMQPLKNSNKPWQISSSFTTTSAYTAAWVTKPLSAVSWVWVPSKIIAWWVFLVYLRS